MALEKLRSLGFNILTSWSFCESTLIKFLKCINRVLDNLQNWKIKIFGNLKTPAKKEKEEYCKWNSYFEWEKTSTIKGKIKDQIKAKFVLNLGRLMINIQLPILVDVPYFITWFFLHTTPSLDSFYATAHLYEFLN